MERPQQRASDSSSPNDTSPGPDDKRLDRQLGYQQFHIGIYVSLATAIIGGSVFYGEKLTTITSHQRWRLAAAIVLLLLAGMCGGMVAVRVPRSSSYAMFADERYGFRFPGLRAEWPKLLSETWESWEHLFFWGAMVAMVWFGLSRLGIAP